uniref:Uncharacterized protein n=1 Tax=Lygus hesperus TaxID=30085 RepID=A0A0A9W353_LYGHE
MCLANVHVRCVVFLVIVMQLNSPWMECYAQGKTTTNTTSTPTTNNTTTTMTPTGTTTKTTPNVTTTTPKPAPEPPISPHPFIVSIAVNHLKSQSNKEYIHLVGAVIINTTAVMSSCHILNQDEYKKNLAAHSMIIVAGTIRIGWGMSKHTQMREVKGIFLHKKCLIVGNHDERIDTKFNVARVTLKDPLRFNTYVQPMTLISYSKVILKTFVNTFTEKKIPCNKTSFLWINTATWPPHPETSFEDSLTRSIAGSLHWKLSVWLVTYPFRLITSMECRASFCILSTEGCKHDYTMHHQVCAYPRRIYRKSRYGNNTPNGNPIVCGGHVFGVWNFVLHKYRCSPDVYSHPECILSLLQDYETPGFLEKDDDNPEDQFESYF